MHGKTEPLGHRGAEKVQKNERLELITQARRIDHARDRPASVAGVLLNDCSQSEHAGPFAQ
jgi:hypothetical protein